MYPVKENLKLVFNRNSYTFVFKGLGADIR